MFDFAPLDTSFHPFSQGQAYAAAARACGAGVLDLDLGAGRALVLRRLGRQLISRGPIWHDGAPLADKRRALRHFARFAGVTIVTPDQELRGAGLIALITPMHHAIWDLSGNLRAGMVGKWRNRLGVAERAELRITAAPLSLLPQLITAEAGVRTARGYRTHSAQFTLSLPPSALRLFQWRHGGDMAAGMAFVVEGATASYHLGWANQAAKAQGVHGLMLYRAALALRATGVRWLDLGSVDTESAPGLARFKLGTGAELRRLGHTLLVLPG